jgi:chromosome partitioning protein
MSGPAPVLTLFNNKGGVGKTSLIYHLAWMLSERGMRILACDLDPQSNLTAAFLDEDFLADLWQGSNHSATIQGCIAPLMEVGDILEPTLIKIASSLFLLPGDIALSGFEDFISSEWPNAMGSGNLFRAFRVLTAFWQTVQLGAKQIDADLILVDVGPNLGAINRSALIASDFVLVPLGADLFSLQGLRNLGPTLRRWRMDWGKRVANWQDKKFALPAGRMAPIGYVVQQHSERQTRPV